MKRILIAGLFLLSACAHTQITTAREPHRLITYACQMEASMCGLIDRGAQQARDGGYDVVRDDVYGVLKFVPAANRTVFYGATIPMVNHSNLVGAGLMPGRTPVISWHGLDVEVHALIGGVELRDSDLADIFEDVLVGVY